MRYTDLDELFNDLEALHTFGWVIGKVFWVLERKAGES